MDKETNQSHERENPNPRWGPQRWARCCPDMGAPTSHPLSGDQGQNPMARCFSCCQRFVLFLAIVGIVVLAIGYYYLGPEVFKTRWMIAVGIAVGMTLLAALAMGRMVRGNGFTGCCCGPWSRRNA